MRSSVVRSSQAVAGWVPTVSITLQTPQLLPFHRLSRAACEGVEFQWGLWVLEGR
jgi:hypothetical protein